MTVCLSNASKHSLEEYVKAGKDLAKMIDAIRKIYDEFFWTAYGNIEEKPLEKIEKMSSVKKAEVDIKNFSLLSFRGWSCDKTND